MLLLWGQITRRKLCYYYTCKFGVISIKYVIKYDIYSEHFTTTYCYHVMYIAEYYLYYYYVVIVFSLFCFVLIFVCFVFFGGGGVGSWFVLFVCLLALSLLLFLIFITIVHYKDMYLFKQNCIKWCDIFFFHLILWIVQH